MWLKLGALLKETVVAEWKMRMIVLYLYHLPVQHRNTRQSLHFLEEQDNKTSDTKETYAV
jgi:hypothetical protein